MQKIIRKYVVIRWGVLLGILTACGSDTTGPALIPSKDLFWKLTLNHHAAVLSTQSPYNTLQLVATPYNSAGSVLQTESTPVFTSRDEEAIIVSPNGLITAQAVQRDVWVNVKMTIRGVTLRDSIRITVTNTASPQALGSFSIQPLPGDSAIGGCKPTWDPTWVITPQVNDVDHQPITPSMVKFWASDTSLAKVDGLTGEVRVACKEETKHVMLYAETTVYGTRAIDSVLYTIIPPSAVQILVNIRKPMGSPDQIFVFEPGTITVSVGAIVTWFSQSADSTGIVFEMPEFVTGAYGGEGGDIAPFATDTLSESPVFSALKFRQFLTPGTYRYRSTRSNATGTVVVRARTP
jgi:plastocyanin